ncbi:nucleotidyltransferase domain-containing protein [Nocardiopsis trehalosi]|uniref:nucleotidyltransferase domain-containing protein n=1 Tax=Nocardiopsis trehalosi TaxID=109329 RepID=UPI00082AEB06|nr:amino acid transporter [Nocardiopsis trehalosi]
MSAAREPFGRWSAAPLAEVARLFSGADRPWWVAGGHAVELAVGRRLREHGDIDVLVLRRDQALVQRVLSGWEWWAADPPGRLRPWRVGEELPAGVHDVWCRPGADAPWRVQVMLDEAAGGEWVSRRDARVRLPVGELGAVSARGVPYVVPRVQLYYKAWSPRPRDEVDFTAALPVPAPSARGWPADAIELTCGPHPWTPRLRGAGTRRG